ncbi:hypothetical protein ABTX99_16220 [Streptomyces flaveolus]|uniref:hypothetical protein n=1 Tax=Streptomyces flaveolus TaxID=67297 RepID=UPI0033236BC8
MKIEAGSVWELSDGGRMDTLDTSPQLAELRQCINHVQGRIAANSRITAAALGLLNPTEVPSGYALQLALGPLDSLVSSMRLARADKYGTLLRMVQRLHRVGHMWPAGEILPAALAWGPHTPTDRTVVLSDVVSGVTNGVMSLETGVRMLHDAGYPIEDVSEEIERIQQRAFDQAARLADATGDNRPYGSASGSPVPT